MEHVDTIPRCVVRFDDGSLLLAQPNHILEPSSLIRHDTAATMALNDAEVNKMNMNGMRSAIGAVL